MKKNNDIRSWNVSHFVSLPGLITMLPKRLVMGGSVAAGVFASGLATWEFISLFNGSNQVVGASTATTDGGVVGTIISSLFWLALLLALIGAVLLSRSASDAVIEGTPNTESVFFQRKRNRAAVIAAGGVLVVAVYHGLLLPGAITWGDWGYYINSSAVRAFFPIPSLWQFSNLGSNNILGAPLFPILSMMGALSHIGFSYNVLERMWFYYPAVLLSFAGPLMLLRKLRVDWGSATLAGVLYSVNPYALVLISGGQLTVGVGYALYPVVALIGLGLWSHRSLSRGALLGAVIGVQAWYDPRTAGLSIALGLITIVSITLTVGIRRVIQRIPWKEVSTGAVVLLLLQGMWILPTLLNGKAHLPSAYTSAGSLNSLSLMSLADGLTIFHPFWPGMKFIALYSIPPLWLIIPFVIAMALWRAPRNSAVIVATSSYLVFSALVSGANFPFGSINTWLFVNIPGMDLFRDPSPYFGPAALAVSILVGMSLSSMRQRVPSPTRVASNDGSMMTTASRLDSWESARWMGMRTFIFGFTIILVIYSGWPAMSGQIHHNLAPRVVPANILQLNRRIAATRPGAVLWIPSIPSFALNSPLHPNISGFSLQSTPGIGFPWSGGPLFWLTNTMLVTELIAKYNIGEVVVDQDKSLFNELSLSRQATLVDARSAFITDRSWHVPGVTLYSLGRALPSPAVILPAKDVIASNNPAQIQGQLEFAPTVTVLSGQPRSVLSGFSFGGLLKKVVASARVQELSVSNFAHGLSGWQSVGDSNNYLDQTLEQAGISSHIYGRGEYSWLRIKDAYGAAAISHQLISCPSAESHVSAVYRTISGAAPVVSIFGNSQASPLGQIQLPVTHGKWESVSVPIPIAESLASGNGATSTECELEWSLAAIQPGNSVAVDIRQLFLTSVQQYLHTSQQATARNAAVDKSVAQRKFRINAKGTDLQLSFVTSSEPRLIVVWQKYDSGWVAATKLDGDLAHVLVNGWANGYVLPAASTPGVVSIRYSPELSVRYGGYCVVAGMSIVALMMLITLRRRRVRERRKNPNI